MSNFPDKRYGHYLSNQGHFLNPHDELILKLPLHIKFGQEFSEKLKVKEQA